MKPEVRQAVAAEFLGTALLLSGVVGSGIMGENLSNGNAALALLANSIATGAILTVLILTFGPLSGAHFNPLVTLVMTWRNGTAPLRVLQYLGAQVAGALVGVACANVMFGLSAFSASQHPRAGAAQAFSEFVATFGLLTVILVCGKFREAAVPYAVACYITAAYWFTASTSFANPVVTVARALTDTFSGIRPIDVPLFVFAQTCGAAVAAGVFQWMRKGSA